MHGLIGGCWGGEALCGGCWSRAGVLRDATTMARSGPQPHGCSAEPVAYLTVEHEAQAAVLYLLAPANEAFPGAKAQRGRAEANERDPLAVLLCDVAKDAPDEVVAEVVVRVEQLVEASDLAGHDETHDEGVELPGASAGRVHRPVCSR